MRHNISVLARYLVCTPLSLALSITCATPDQEKDKSSDCGNLAAGHGMRVTGFRDALASALLLLAMLAGSIALSAWGVGIVINHLSASAGQLSEASLQHQVAKQLSSANTTLTSGDPRAAALITQAASTQAFRAALAKSPTAADKVLASQVSAQDPALATAINTHDFAFGSLTHQVSPRLHRISTLIAEVLLYALIALGGLMAAALVIHTHRSAVFAKVGRRALYLASGGLLMVWVLPLIVSHMSASAWYASLARQFTKVTSPSHPMIVVLGTAGVAAMLVSYTLTWFESSQRAPVASKSSVELPDQATTSQL
jgi:hypothetical protein